MKNISNIAILTMLLLLFVVACTPQIRFATKTSLVTKSAPTSKVQPSNKKADLTTFNISEFLNNTNLDTKRKEVLMFAESYIGTPYCYGGIDKNCTDCSGFVKQIFDMAGINLPRTAELQYNYGRDIGDNETRPGDLVFFTRKNKIGHVGIYIGNNQFIHASTNKGVILQRLDDDFYKQTFAGFKKVL